MRGECRQALLEGLGAIEESKTGNSAAVKPEEIGQEEDREMLEETEKTRFRNLAATLNHMSLDSMRTCNTPRKRYARRWLIRHEEAEKRFKKACGYLCDGDTFQVCARRDENRAIPKL